MPELNDQQFPDAVRRARQAAFAEGGRVLSVDKCASLRAEGGCFAAAEVLSQETGFPTRQGLVLNERDEFVESGPDYWHAFAPHREDYQSRPDMKYSREELEENLGAEAEDQFGAHAWVETPEGGVLDPTGDQFGGPVGPRILGPDDPERGRYWTFPDWRG